MKNVLLVLLTLIYSCGESQIIDHQLSSKDEQVKSINDEDYSISHSCNNFAFDYFAKMPHDKPHVISSPYSMFIGLSLLYTGANFNTKNEIAQALNITVSDSIFLQNSKKNNRKP